MAFEQIYLSSGKCNWKLVNGLSAAPIRVPKSFGLDKTLNDLFSICCLWNELKIKSTAMAGERVLDRFDSFDLGKQNTTHIFRLSTFASSRHNYTLIVLANILQRSMKSPGALAAATAASDFMRFLAYFTNLPRSARSRKRIKKKCQRGNRRNQVEHPVTFSKLKPPHQYYGFPWLVLSVGDMKLWWSKFNANVLEVGQNHIYYAHTYGVYI